MVRARMRHSVVRYCLWLVVAYPNGWNEHRYSPSGAGWWHHSFGRGRWNGADQIWLERVERKFTLRPTVSVSGSGSVGVGLWF